MTATECLTCTWYEEQPNDEEFDWCNHYEDCISKDYDGMCHCEIYWTQYHDDHEEEIEEDIENALDELRIKHNIDINYSWSPGQLE